MSEPVLIWLLFERDGAALLARRKAERPPFAGQWALPGDRLAENDSASELIASFAREQLDVTVQSEEFVDTFFLNEGGIDYAVNVFRPLIDGDLRYRESGPFAELRWVTPAAALELTGAPRPLVEMLGGKRHWSDETRNNNRQADRN